MRLTVTPTATGAALGDRHNGGAQPEVASARNVCVWEGGGRSGDDGRRTHNQPQAGNAHPRSTSTGPLGAAGAGREARRAAISDSAKYDGTGGGFGGRPLFRRCSWVARCVNEGGGQRRGSSDGDRRVGRGGVQCGRRAGEGELTPPPPPHPITNTRGTPPPPLPAASRNIPSTPA
jgi:hypothetical protein